MPGTRNVDPEISRLRATLAVATRDGDKQRAEDAKRSLKYAVTERHIKELIESWPLPTPDQCERLAALLRTKQLKQ